MGEKNKNPYRSELVSATKRHLDCSQDYPQRYFLVTWDSSLARKKEEEKKLFPFVLCVSLTALFMTTREEMFEGAPEENQQRIK